MSVLIMGLDMPKSCAGCIFDVWGSCLINSNIEPKNKLTHSCPLIELPDHGDLIDESETVEAQYYDDEHEEWSIKTKTVGDVLAEICEVPPKVVIPADCPVYGDPDDE